MSVLLLNLPCRACVQLCVLIKILALYHHHHQKRVIRWCRAVRWSPGTKYDNSWSIQHVMAAFTRVFCVWIFMPMMCCFVVVFTWTWTGKKRSSSSQHWHWTNEDYVREKREGKSSSCGSIAIKGIIRCWLCWDVFFALLLKCFFIMLKI